MPKETPDRGKIVLPDNFETPDIASPMLFDGDLYQLISSVDSEPLRDFLSGENITMVDFLEEGADGKIPTEDNPDLPLMKRAERAMYKATFLALAPVVYLHGDTEKNSEASEELIENSLKIAEEVKGLANILITIATSKQRKAKNKRRLFLDSRAVFERPGDMHSDKAKVYAEESLGKIKAGFDGTEDELRIAVIAYLDEECKEVEITFAKSNDDLAKVKLVKPFVENITNFLIDKLAEIVDQELDQSEEDEVLRPDLSKMTMPPVLLSQAITVDPVDRREDVEPPAPSAYINTVVPDTSFSVSDQATEPVVLVQPERKGYGKRIAMALTGIFAIGGVAATSAVVIYQQENNIAEDIGSSADLKDAAPSGVVAEPGQKKEIAEAVEEPEVVQEIPEATNWPELYSEYLYMYYNRGNAEVPHADVCELITMVRTDGYTKRKLTVKTPKSMGDIKEFNGQKRLPNNELHGPIQVGAERKHKIDVFLPVYSPKATSITVEWDLDGEVSRRTYQLGDSPFYGLEAFTLIDGSNIKEEGSKLTLKVYMRGEEKPLNEKVFEVQLLAEDELVSPQKVQKKTVRAVNSIVEPMPEAISEEPELEPASVPEPAPIVEEPTNKKGRKNKKRKRN